MVEHLRLCCDEARSDMRLQLEMIEWASRMIAHCATRKTMVARPGNGEDFRKSSNRTWTRLPNEDARLFRGLVVVVGKTRVAFLARNRRMGDRNTVRLRTRPRSLVSCANLSSDLLKTAIILGTVVFGRAVLQRL